VVIGEELFGVVAGTSDVGEDDGLLGEGARRQSA
jgi:hypothetical protein